MYKRQIFDKTGTLTSGQMSLLEVLPLGVLDREACLALAAAIEQSSEHPVGAALRKAATGTLLPELAGVSNEPGSGMQALHQGIAIRVGRPDYVAAVHGQPLPDSARSLAASSDTVIALGNDTGLSLIHI